MAVLSSLISFVGFLLILLSNINLTKSNITKNPSHFANHEVIKPKICNVTEQSTIQENGRHVIYRKKIILDMDDKTLILDVALNSQLISKGFFYKHQKNGKNVVSEPTKEEIDHCYYRGKVIGKKKSWVAISTCKELSGIIYDGEGTYYNIENSKIIYKYSNIENHSSQHTDIDIDKKLRNKRSTSNVQLIRGPSTSNNDSKYIELLLVVDNRKFKELGEDKQKTVDYCKNVANIVNALYAPLNIFIALVGVVIWSEKDEIELSSNSDRTLRNFLHYRQTKLNPIHPNDNAQLVTKMALEDGVYAKALKGPICTYEYSGGVNVDYSPAIGWIAASIAHTLGHNLGMEHDTKECKCPIGVCIMAPHTNSTLPTHWSTCSLDYLHAAFTHGMDYCLQNKPESLFDGPVCGNGFVEPGEECDCGLQENCINNNCCDAISCKLYKNASCATGECCDLNTCQLKASGTLCRPANHECDLPEYCNSQSEHCPSDIFKMDTEPCSNGEAFCYHGLCRTRTEQCKLLWGETGNNSDNLCYSLNVKGSRHGNCGYNKLNATYYKCDAENSLCGVLHCNHSGERLEFGMESVSIITHSFVKKKGSIILCMNVHVNLGTQRIDPGLTPNGAKCGENKMCVDQKCKSIADLRKNILACPRNCNGNGWCNNQGYCLCKSGFAPPLCE